MTNIEITAYNEKAAREYAATHGIKLVPVDERQWTDEMRDAGRAAVMAAQCASKTWTPRRHFEAAGRNTNGIPDDVLDERGPLTKESIAVMVMGAMLAAAPEVQPQPAPGPAIDLEQFRPALEHALLSIQSEEKRADIDRLLALIDGQSKSGYDTQRLEWLMRNISGAELRRLNVWTDASCDRAAIDKAMQPTKGEGE